MKKILTATIIILSLFVYTNVFANTFNTPTAGTTLDESWITNSGFQTTKEYLNGHGSYSTGDFVLPSSGFVHSISLDWEARDNNGSNTDCEDSIGPAHFLVGVSNVNYASVELGDNHAILSVDETYLTLDSGFQTATFSFTGQFFAIQYLTQIYIVIEDSPCKVYFKTRKLTSGTFVNSFSPDSDSQLALTLIYGQADGLDFDNADQRSNGVMSDFDNWEVCFDLPVGHNVSSYYINSIYGPTSDPDLYLDDNSSSPRPLVLGQLYNYPNNVCSVWTKSTDLSPGFYQVQFEAYDQDDNLIATSIVRYFQIVSGAKTSFMEVKYFNYSQIPDSVQFGYEKPCSPVNGIARSVCDVASYLFIPNSSSGSYMQEKVVETKDELLTKQPFSYLTLGEDEVNDFLSTETIDDTLDITLPSPFGEDQGPLDIELINPDNPIADNVDLIKPWITIGIWLSFAFYLFYRPFKLFKHYL